MSPSLRNVAALIAAVAVLQLALGLMGVHLPIAFAADGYSPTQLGFVAAAYSGGFMAAAYFATMFLARVGHIRVFAASAAIFSAATLLLHFVGDFWGWIVARVIAGAAVALLFAAVESWLASSIGSRERGDVMGFYMVATRLAIALGPFLTFGYAASAPEPWMIAAAIAAIAMLPVCFTTSAQPEPPKAMPIALGEQFATAPAAVIACFGAGLVNGALLTLAPLFAADHYGPGAASSFYAAAWIGTLLMQWPAGRISDTVDRRLIIAALAGLAALSALPLALAGGRLSEPAAVAFFFLWGAGGLSFYGVAIAHMADRAELGRMAQSASGLLFVWAGGAIIGPILLGPLVDMFGWSSMFWFAAAGAGAVAGAMFWRLRRREAAEPERKEDFAPLPATSVASADIAFGDKDEGAEP